MKLQNQGSKVKDLVLLKHNSMEKMQLTVGYCK